MASETAVHILEGALSLLRGGDSVTLESAARNAGLTKPGLMYHFPTKAALMLGLVDYVVDRWHAELTARGGHDSAHLDAAARISAYLDFALRGAVDEADLVTVADPRLREPLIARWVERMGSWWELGEDIGDDERARLLCVRMIADGAWFDRASGARTLGPGDRQLIEKAAHTLLTKGGRP